MVSVPRVFTLLEAEALLPRVQQFLQTLVEHKREYETAEAELNRINQRIALTGGMSIDRQEVQHIRTRKDSNARSVKETLDKIQEIGCELKDIEIGLVDFPALYRGQEVYLCWKLGESGIGFWHHVEDGYRGRRPIDSDFLAGHAVD
jgi:hypothetical protein